MSIELMLLGVNLNFIIFSVLLDDLMGQITFNPNTYLGLTSVTVVSPTVKVQLSLVWK